MTTNNTLLEYIWLDGYDTPNLRSKIKVVHDWDGLPPQWNFDGSSTKQAQGHDSECLLDPVRVYNYEPGHFFVLCEVVNPDGTPHESNQRARLKETEKFANSNSFWWGFEQEYFLTKEKHPLGFPTPGCYPEPQGLYYCGVGGNQVKGRDLVEVHLRKCLDMGIQLTGVNAEVAVGQWEFQCFAKDTLKACDDLWVSRYLLYKLSETYGLDADLSPKPVKGDWNGSGCHTNFSDNSMRTEGNEDYFMSVLNSLDRRHLEHIDGYGADNDLRLTGLHETQYIGQFSWGVADRGASIRVPLDTAKTWHGYLEDRRPASNCDPYRVSRLIVDAVRSIQS